jgi:uncharacterized protein (TIGR02147 family)
MTIYLVNDYHEFIERMLSANQHVRGYKTRLAEAAGCHSSHFSQVLRKHVDLSLEQAMNLATFWELDENETDFFLDMVLRDRAGQPLLRQFYEDRLSRARAVRDLTKFPQEAVLPKEVAQKYYSSWHYAAVHVLALTPEYSGVDRMASRLRVPTALVLETLRELEAMGVIARDGIRWVERTKRNHLPRNSPLNATNQVGWRTRAIQNLQNRDPDALHLLLLSAVSKSDIAKLKAKLAECLEDLRQASDASKKEDGIAITIDLFRI